MMRKHANDEAITVLLDAHAAERGGRVVVEQVDGHWRAGFLIPDDLGESVIALSGSGPDPQAARRQLLIRTAEALERSASLAMQHAERLERAGRNDDAGRERRAAKHARQAAERARLYAEGKPEQAGRK